VRVAFADCVFDTETRELRRGGSPVHVSPKAFRLLEALLASRPNALSRPDIFDKVWPDTFVSASSLGRLMAEVRAAIGDDRRETRLVRTIHGFGYAFCGPVVDATEAPTHPAPSRILRVAWGGRESDLPEGTHLVGREPGCAVRIEAAGVSRRHARIVVAGGQATIEDLGSKNGTFLRGLRIHGPETLAEGDTVGVGAAMITVSVIAAGRTTETLPGPPDASRRA
jgi:DNA-binding winged helix-turn-helix (wHTH) protein